MTIPRDLAFSESEYARRLAAVRHGMADRRLDALVIFTPGSINYLSGLDDNSLADPTALIVPADRDPILVLFWFEEGRAANSSWLTDVRLYRVPNDPVPGAGFVPAVVEALRSAGLAGSRIALETGPGGISPADHATLIEALQDATIDDSWPIVEVVRRVKSDAGDRVHPSRGSDHGRRRRGGRPRARGRRARHRCWRGDPRSDDTPRQRATVPGPDRRRRVPGGRAAQLHRACRDPGRRYRLSRIHRPVAPLLRARDADSNPRRANAEQARAAEAGGDALQAVIETARPGIAASEVARIAGSIIAPAVASGLRFHGNFGYTVGLGYPPTWTERLGFQLRPDNDAAARGRHDLPPAGVAAEVRRVGHLPERDTADHRNGRRTPDAVDASPPRDRGRLIQVATMRYITAKTSATPSLHTSRPSQWRRNP